MASTPLRRGGELMLVLTWMFTLGAALIVVACIDSVTQARWDRRDQQRFEADRAGLEAWLASFREKPPRARQRPLRQRRVNA